MRHLGTIVGLYIIQVLTQPQIIASQHTSWFLWSGPCFAVGGAFLGQGGSNIDLWHVKLFDHGGFLKWWYPAKSFKSNHCLVSKTMVTWLSPILSPKYRPHVNVKSVVRFVLQFCQEASKMATSWFAVSEVLENNQIIIGESSCQRFKILWTIIARNLHTFWGDFPIFSNSV